MARPPRQRSSGDRGREAARGSGLRQGQGWMNVRSGLGIEREKRSRWEMGTRWERRTRSKRLRPDPGAPFLDTRAVGMRVAATGLQPMVTKKATSNIKIRETAFSGSTVGLLRARERRIDARRAAPGLGPPCLGRKEHRPARPGVSDRADMSDGRQGDIGAAEEQRSSRLQFAIAGSAHAQFARAARA